MNHEIKPGDLYHLTISRNGTSRIVHSETGTVAEIPVQIIAAVRHVFGEEANIVRCQITTSPGKIVIKTRVWRKIRRHTLEEITKSITITVEKIDKLEEPQHEQLCLPAR